MMSLILFLFSVILSFSLSVIALLPAHLLSQSCYSSFYYLSIAMDHICNIGGHSYLFACYVFFFLKHLKGQEITKSTHNGIIYSNTLYTMNKI